MDKPPGIMQMILEKCWVYFEIKKDSDATY
jgi:hypothetical protein